MVSGFEIRVGATATKIPVPSNSLLQVEKSLSLAKTVAPGQACLALIGAQNNLEDIPIRVPRCRKRRKFEHESWERSFFAKDIVLVESAFGRHFPYLAVLAK